MAAKRSPANLPTKQDVLSFIADNKGAVGKREIARAFGIRGSDKIYLKQLLKELDADGEIERGRGRRLAKAGILPPVGVVEVSEVDEDGTLFARPTGWRQAEAPPRIRVLPGRRVTSALGIGDRVLARLEEAGKNRFDAHVMRRLEAAPSAILGTYQAVGTDGRIAPADRRAKNDYTVRRENAGAARSGDVVLAEPLPGRARGLREAKVTDILGNLKSPTTLSTIALHKYGIPTEFPADALAEAAAMQPTRLGAREDLRDLPLVTIDPRDARDHDDAVWAEADTSSDNPGGWRLIVAIADVGHFVRPGQALDREARRRGNSVYLPDRVVPMLPETLSNDLCSLKSGRSRPVMVCHMRIDRDGQKIAHHFTRAYMRSAAALTYAQVQAAQDGKPDDATEPLLSSVIEPLYGAYQALHRARGRRSPLALDMPERRVTLNDDGSITAIQVRERLDSHKLIEEFMVLANVAAAETLTTKHAPCMYRIHEPPASEKVKDLRKFLDGLGLKLAGGQTPTPDAFNTLLAQAADTPQAALINQVVLRSQTQAFYAPDDRGHYGLHLRRYAHFTSPIRRYGDLIVHRALIAAGKLGANGLTKDAAGDMAQLGEAISDTERRAMLAERDTLDAYTAAFLADRVGADFAGTVNGVTRFGLFITLNDTGADGLVPIRSLGTDYYLHDETHHRLTGERTGETFCLGDSVTVRLVEAAPINGGLRFELLRDGESRQPTKRSKSPPRNRRARRRR